MKTRFFALAMLALALVACNNDNENLKTTQIYLSSIDTMAVTKANKKMIDKILK